MRNNRSIYILNRAQALCEAKHFDLILVRGVSGSGKSTFANDLDRAIRIPYDAVPAKVIEADQYFIKDGRYQFNYRDLGKAHDFCHNTVRERALRGQPTIVANTLTREFELQPYFDIAEQFEGLDVCVVDLYTQFENVHGIPPEAVNKQALRFIPCEMLPDRFDFTGIKVYGN